MGEVGLEIEPLNLHVWRNGKCFGASISAGDGAG